MQEPGVRQGLRNSLTIISNTWGSLGNWFTDVKIGPANRKRYPRRASAQEAAAPPARAAWWGGVHGAAQTLGEPPLLLLCPSPSRPYLPPTVFSSGHLSLSNLYICSFLFPEDRLSACCSCRPAQSRQHCLHGWGRGRQGVASRSSDLHLPGPHVHLGMWGRPGFGFNHAGRIRNDL